MYIIAMHALEGTNYHPMQSQSHRTACWEDGYIAVPQALEEKVLESEGYCDLLIENDLLTDVFLTEKPAQPEPEASEQEDLAYLMLDHEYRLALLELGGE